MSKLSEAVAFVETNYPLPRCEHGHALRDHASDVLEPPCGCRLYVASQPPPLPDRPVCKWKLTSSEFGPVWSTGCGDVHEVTDGHSLHPFCAYCGGKLEEVIPAVEDNDE